MHVPNLASSHSIGGIVCFDVCQSYLRMTILSMFHFSCVHSCPVECTCAVTMPTRQVMKRPACDTTDAGAPATSFKVPPALLEYKHNNVWGARQIQTLNVWQLKEVFTSQQILQYVSGWIKLAFLIKY